MRQRYKLKDTTYAVREDFSKETVEISKSYGIRLKSCGKMESLQLSNKIRLLRGVFKLDGSICFSELWFYYSGRLLLFYLK